MFARILFIATVLLASQPLQAAPPSVERISPAAGQRGTSFQITVVGAGLQQAVEAMLYEPGVVCERLEPKSENELVLHLKASADCSVGMHSLRIRSASGISELSVFGISSLPVILETEPNDSEDESPLISGSTTVVGIIESGDVDSFRITLKKGDRLSAEVEAIRAAGAMLDAVLNVMSPDGNWLASVDDTALRRQDPLVSLIAPMDGEYIVQIHETNFEGDEASRYALHIGSFPAPTSVFPAGGPAGEMVSVTFAGDASGDFAQAISLRDLSPGTTSVFAEQNGERSATGLPFRVSPFGNVLEAEPNDLATELEGSAAALPIALNGILQESGDVDCFLIHADAGQRINIEVFASRLGSPVDTLLEIRDREGRVVGSSDDGISHDSQVVVVFPKSDDYIVQLTDKRGNGGDGYFYRVELSPFQPQVTAFLARPDRRSQERQAIAVPRGNRVLTSLACQRTGFSGDVHLIASGLPEGVSLPGTVIPADRFWVPMVIEAASDAPLSGALADVEASGQAGSESVIGHFRQVVDLVSASADQLFQAAEVDRLAIAVVEEVPYSIELQTPVTSLAPDGTLDLQITVKRSEGFRGPLEVSFPFLPPWVDGPDKVNVPSGQTVATYPIHAWPKAVPRTWQICAEARPGIDASASGSQMQSEERGRQRRKPIARTAVASNLVSLTIESSPVSGVIGTVAVEQGQKSKVNCRLEVTGELPQSMTAVLEGLPNRVSAQDVSVTASDEHIVFELQPEETSPVGTFADLMVRLNGQVNGQDVSWRIGRGGVLKIESAGKLVIDESGKPLSRLDVLRREAQKKN